MSLLANPARLDGRGERLQIGVGREVGQIVFLLAGRAPLADQPNVVARQMLHALVADPLRPPVGDAHADGGEAGLQGSLGSLSPGERAPFRLGEHVFSAGGEDIGPMPLARPAASGDGEDEFDVARVDLLMTGKGLSGICARGHNRADGGRIWRSRRTRWMIFCRAETRRRFFRRTDELKKALAERVLNAELDDNLDNEAAEGSRNRRNGYSKKTVLTETAKIDVRIPRDREGTFDPKLIQRYQRRFPGFDDKIVSMYARGMTVREIQGHLLELYGLEVSPDVISTVTDAVLETVAEWQNRPLETSYPLSSDAKCNTPRRFDIGKVVQDLKECCHAILFASVGGRKRPDRRFAGRGAVDGGHCPGARSGESYHLPGTAAERTPFGRVLAASRRRSLSIAQAA